MMVDDKNSDSFNREDKFTCFICNGIFTKGRSDDVAMAEFKKRLPLNKDKVEHLAYACDDCFKTMKKE